MDEVTPRTLEASCGNCGASIPIPASGGIVRCSFCSASLWVESAGTVRHMVYRPAVRQDEIEGHVGRWLYEAGSRLRPRIDAARLVYYPFWRVARGQHVELRPAASSAEGPLDEIVSPAGEMVPFEEGMEDSGRFVPAAMAPPAASAADGDELWLVHVPVYEVPVELAGKSETIHVEGTAGKVVAATAPPGTLGSGSARDVALLWAGAGVLIVSGAALPWEWAVIACWVAAGAALLLGLGRGGRGGG